MDIFSKERRGEDGDVVQTVLIIGIFVIIVMVMGSLIYQAIGSKFAKNENTVVSNLGSSMEQWTVSNPNSTVPFTKNYVRFEDYDFVLDNDIKDVSSSLAAETYVKVVESSEGTSSFKICAYTSDRRQDDPSNVSVFDSVTGELSTVESDVCAG